MTDIMTMVLIRQVATFRIKRNPIIITIITKR